VTKWVEQNALVRPSYIVAYRAGLCFAASSMGTGGWNPQWVLVVKVSRFLDEHENHLVRLRRAISY